MQTFPSVFLYNIFREKPYSFRRRGEKSGPPGRIFRKNMDAGGISGVRTRSLPSGGPRR